MFGRTYRHTRPPGRWRFYHFGSNHQPWHKRVCQNGVVRSLSVSVVLLNMAWERDFYSEGLVGVVVRVPTLTLARTT